MKRLTQTAKIAEFLKEHAGRKFNAREIAEAIVGRYPADYTEKRANPRFADDQAFIQQIIAEIGAQKGGILGQDARIRWQDKPRPRVFWFDPEFDPGTQGAAWTVAPDEELDESDVGTITELKTLSENDLYPLMIQYLKTEHGLYCLRIDEKRSKNSKGIGGNHWLHPDIVAMEPIAKGWHELVQTCVRAGDGQSVRLWSFEVKKELTRADVRRSFFQAVSNSSWANEAYLVATSIADNHVEQELRMLSALHGIGVILLDPENPSESDILLPAKAKQEVDWQSVNRLVEENEDFKDFVDLVSTYYQTGRLRAKDWSK